MLPGDQERRTRVLGGGQEIRIEQRDEDARVLGGTAALFDQVADLGAFTETIKPGAFTDALAASDVRALFNHNPDHVLGRVPNTLRLKETDAGLEYEVDVPETNLGRDVVALIERGDITGNSFSFVVGEDEWKYEEDGTAHRTILSVKELYDVGPVTYPAYPDTVVSARASAQALKDQARPDDFATYADMRVRLTRP